MTDLPSKAASPMDAASADAPQEAGLPLSQRCHDCYEFGHEECACGECGAAYCGPLRVGAQVMFAEDEHNTTSLGVVSRVWPNGKYVSVICDGHLYVRLIKRVRVLAAVTGERQP